MEQKFWRYFMIVAAAHLTIFVVYLLVNGCHSLFKPKPEIMMPVEIITAPPVKKVSTPKITPPAPKPKPQPKPKPSPKPKPNPKPKPKPKPKKVKISHKRVVRGDNPPQKNINPQEIKKILSNNIKTGKTTTYNPSLTAVDLARIKSALYDAWHQPGREEAGGITVKAEITLAIDGRIIGRRLIKPSGNPVLDNSVMQALNSVHKIYGLSQGFTKHHKKVIIEFMVD